MKPLNRIFRSIRLQLGISLLFAVSLVSAGMVFGIIGFGEITETELLLDIVADQKAEVFRQAELVRRLEGAEDEAEIEAIINMLTESIELFDERQGILTTGSDELEPFAEPRLLPLLSDMNNAWGQYRSVLLAYTESEIAEPETLSVELDRQSTRVFALATQLENATEFNLQQSRQELIQFSLRDMILAAIVLVFGIYNAVSFVRTTGKLQRAAKSFGAGDDEAKAPTKTFTELAAVGLAFNSMAERLNLTIEELKVARDEAIEGQRLAQESSRLKSEFLSTMSHELRTPLNAIEGFTSIMLGGMGVELSPKAEGMLQRVSANSKRLLHLINDFLDLSRIESGRLELVTEPLSPHVLAQKWQNEVGVLAAEKKLNFVVNVSDDLPPIILSDEDALTKVAINLLSNAFKFTHEGHVMLDLQRNNGYWSLSVTDTGIGIPVYAREYIFDEFRQVDGSSKRKYGGTGLGLSLVQKIARAMNGSVTLQSEVDKGSTFTVTLPLEVPGATNGQPQSGNGDTGQDKITNADVEVKVDTSKGVLSS